MILTKEQAQELTLPADVWLEESGGYDRSRYRAQKVTAYEKNDYGLFFLTHSGRAWNGYNSEYCGWRLWDSEPTLDEQLAEGWTVAY